MIRVTTSCCSRFHIFDQAKQLERLGVLNFLVQTDPKFLSRRWGIPDGKVKSFILIGMMARFLRHLPNNIQIYIAPKIRIIFAKKLSRNIPAHTDLFIGLSSYSLESIIECKLKGIISVVDHGSLHLEVERELIAEEENILCLSNKRSITPEVLIARENDEFNLANHIIVLSQAAKNSLIKKGIPEQKIFVNPCGVDLEQFYFKTKHNDPFRVIFCGSITPRKGLHYLLQAFTELAIPQSELWVVGKSSDIEYIDLLKKRFKSPAIIYKGAFPQSELVNLYNKCSVFVLPSIADGFGMVVPQAMACGLPVITTANVGAADIINDGINGFIVPIREVGMLKQKIKLLYDDPSLREKMSNSALITSKQYLSWNGYGERLISFLNAKLNHQSSLNKET